MDQNFLNAATQNFNLPHDVVELPTRGIFYKSKKKSVKVGYLTASDENIIANYLSGNKTKDGLVLSLIRSKLYESDLRPEELLSGDVQAILLFLRNTSFGPEYNFSMTDPADGKKFEGSVLLDEVNIRKTNVQPDENGEFTTILPRTGVEVKLKPLTLMELQDINERVDTYPRGMVAPKITWQLQKMITAIGGETDRGSIVQFVDQMPIMDSKHIKKFMDDNEPMLDLRKEVVAPSGEIVTLNVTFGVEFFRPFL